MLSSTPALPTSSTDNITLTLSEDCEIIHTGGAAGRVKIAGEWIALTVKTAGSSVTISSDSDGVTIDIPRESTTATMSRHISGEVQAIELDHSEW